MSAEFKTEGSFPTTTPIAWGTLRGQAVTLKAGAVYPAGAVLGEITADGKHVLATAAATDGSQAPVKVLAEAVDATGGDVAGIAYITGDFSAPTLTFGNGITQAAARKALHTRAIYLHNVG